MGIGKQMFREAMKVMGDRNVGMNSLSNRITFYTPFGWSIKSYTVHYNQGPVNPEFIAVVPEGDFEVVSARDIKLTMTSLLMTLRYIRCRDQFTSVIGPGTS